jgi:alkylation response protein AidB-like acyl-CoA dehydrogenase
MCLTEPHCGTDLGLMRTKAEPQADGTYKITGNKIFISAGEHDMATTSFTWCWRVCPMRLPASKV